MKNRSNFGFRRMVQAFFLALLVIPFLSSCKKKNDPDIPLSDKNALTDVVIRVGETEFPAEVQTDGKTWLFAVPWDFNHELLEKAIISFTIPQGATAVPASGSEVGLNDPLTITVTAENKTSTETYTVEKSIFGTSSEAAFTSFTLTVGTEDYTGIIDDVNSKVTFDYYFDASMVDAIAEAVPVFAVSVGAKVDPKSGEAQDFNEPVEYTITAFDKTERTWTVELEIIVTPVIPDGAINVTSFGAMGDGQTDDTKAIQDAIDYAESQGGGIVYVPDGRYMIKANIDRNVTNFLYDEGGVALKDNVHLLLSNGATLKAIPTTRGAYQILRVFEKNNVIIEGGTIEGERYEHLADAGEWGYGIAILGGSNITIRNLTAKDCWGDGLNIQNSDWRNISPARYPTNITIDNVRCLYNCRQGLSIEAGYDITVKNSHFSFTSGAPLGPCCGIDIEPWAGSNPVERVIIENCVFEDNASSGLLLMNNSIDGVLVKNCHFLGNRDSEAQLKTFWDPKNIIVEGCRFEQKNGVGSRNAIMFSDANNLTAIDNEFINSILFFRSIAVPVVDVKIENNTFTFSSTYAAEVVYFGSSDQAGSQNFRNITFDGNTFDLTGHPVAGTQRVMLYGQNVVFQNNELLGVHQGIDVFWAPDIKIENNKIHGSPRRAGQIANSANALFNNNVISGAGHNAGGNASFNILAGSDGATITNNQFFQTSQIPVSGTQKSSRALSIASGLTGITLEGNTVDPDDGSYPLQ